MYTKKHKNTKTQKHKNTKTQKHNKEEKDKKNVFFTFKKNFLNDILWYSVLYNDSRINVNHFLILSKFDIFYDLFIKSILSYSNESASC